MRIVRPVVFPCKLAGPGPSSDSKSESDMGSDSESEESSVRSLSQPGMLLLLGKEVKGGRPHSSSTSDTSSSMVVTSLSSMEVVVVNELVLRRREGVSMEVNLRCFQSLILHLTQRSMLVCAGNTSLHPGMRQRRFTLFISQNA